MKKSTLILTLVSVALGTLAVCFGIGYFVNYSRSNNRANTINGMYERSFYELVDNVNSMESNISKLIVSNSYENQQKLLSDIVKDSVSAQNNLSFLPIRDDSLVNTTKFVNQVNGYCTSLINYQDNIIDASKIDALEKIYDNVSTIKYELNSMTRNINSGYRIVDNLSSDNNLTNSLVSIANESIEYPTLIYDGPFSDSQKNKTIKGLNEIECTQEEAKNYLYKKFLGWGVSNLEFVRETNSDFKTYDFDMTLSNGCSYYAQVTKRGMFLLSMNGSCTNGDRDISDEECKTMAEKFVRDFGITDMSVVWSASSDGICYLNLATKKDNVIIYPEMIKIKVDKTSGKIIGWEASSYAYNYDADRGSVVAKIGATDARAKVSSKVSIKTQRLCVIPQEYGEEILCYELCGSYMGSTYYVYIDATLGVEVKVLKVIQTDNGELIL